MTTMQPDPTQFDEMCAGVGEWDPLPTIPTESAVEHDEQPEPVDEQAESLDEQILAGLVSPY